MALRSIAASGAGFPRPVLALPFFGLAVVVGLMLGTEAWIAAAAALGCVIGVLGLLTGRWWVAMVWLAVSPTVAVFFNNLLQGIPFFRTERVLLLVLVGYFVADVTFRKRSFEALDRVERCMLAFLAVCLGHALWTLNDKSLVLWSKEDAALLYDGYLMPMLAYFIARRLHWHGDRARHFLWLMGGTALFLAATAPLETLFGVNWFIPKYLDVIHILKRATGTFGNAASYGAVMGSLFLLTGLLYVHARTPAQRVALGMLLAVILGAVLLSKTRAAWVGLMVALVVVYGKEPASRSLLRLLGLLGAMAGVIVLPPLLASQGFQDRALDAAPVYNRIASTAAALNMMVQNPLTGVGFSRAAFGLNRGAYAVDVGDVSGAWIRELAVPHNEFLNVGAMTGLVGFVLYLRVFVAMFSALARNGREGDSPFVRSWSRWVFALWVCWCVNASFADFANLGYINILLYFSAGVAAALARPPQGQTR